MSTVTPKYSNAQIIAGISAATKDDDWEAVAGMMQMLAAQAPREADSLLSDLYLLPGPRAEALRQAMASADEPKTTLCLQCESGNHRGHDTWASGPNKGSDAGCPRAVGFGRENYRGDSICRCPVRNLSQGDGRWA